MFSRSSDSPIEFIFSDQLSPCVRHGFTTARNGHSAGAFGRGNLSRCVGDDSIAVERNWQDLLRSTGQAAIAVPRQVHGIGVLRLDGPLGGAAPEADALWTSCPNVAVGVLTADCMPILLEMCDRQGQVQAVAAVHAGWKGAYGNILDACISDMQQHSVPFSFATSRALIGPSICGQCYEVGIDLAEKFTGRGYTEAVTLSKGNSFLDLWKVAVLQLSSLGFLREHIDIAAECTKCSEGYFSYRRCAETGRELAFIWME